MQTLNIKRPGHNVAVNLELRKRKSGSVDVVAVSQNGHGEVKVLRLTASGYLRRFPGLPKETGMRRTPDGRLAKKVAKVEPVVPAQTSSF